MSLNDLPDEIIALIVAQSYQIKLASVFRLDVDVDRYTSKSTFLISYARRTPVYPLSMVSKRIRTICIPTLFSRVLVKDEISGTVLSGNLQQLLKLNVDRLHLIKQVHFSNVRRFDVVKPLLKAFFNLELAVFSPWHLKSMEYLKSTGEHPTLKNRVIEPIEHQYMVPSHVFGEDTLFRKYSSLNFLDGVDSLRFLGTAKLAEAYTSKRFVAEDQTFCANFTLPGLRRLHLRDAWQNWSNLREEEDVIRKFSSFISKHPDLRIITFTPALTVKQNKSIPLPFPCVHEALGNLTGKWPKRNARIMSMGVNRDEAGTWHMREVSITMVVKNAKHMPRFSLNQTIEAMPGLPELNLTILTHEKSPKKLTDHILKQLSGAFRPLQLRLTLRGPQVFKLQESTTYSEMRKKVIDFATDLARGVPSLSLLELEKFEAFDNSILRVERQEGGKYRIVPQMKVDGYVNEEPDASPDELGRDKYLDLSEEEWNG